MDRTEALDRATRSASGHLATVGVDGAPHLVVVTFAVLGGNVVTAVDHKPKTTMRLRRLTNIEENGRASFLVDHFEDDWSRLWWARIDGTARVIRDGPEHTASIDALVEKYHQYQENRPPGPVISLSIDRVTHWSSTL